MYVIDSTAISSAVIKKKIKKKKYMNIMILMLNTF